MNYVVSQGILWNTPYCYATLNVIPQKMIVTSLDTSEIFVHFVEYPNVETICFTNSDDVKDCSGLLEILNEALSMNKLV